MEAIYAALLLHKSGSPIDEEHINKVLNASGAKVDESKIKSLVASLKGIDIDAELKNAIVASTVSVVSSDKETKAEEAPKQEKREESAAGLSALFG
ncbi:MAG: 50S ribosomal protein L12 [Nanoarchaeota archaeon]